MRGIARTAMLILLIVIIVIAGAASYTLLSPRQTPRVSEIKVGIVQPLSGSLSTIGKYNLWGASSPQRRSTLEEASRASGERT